jgi:hypothetical protein
MVKVVISESAFSAKQLIGNNPDVKHLPVGGATVGQRIDFAHISNVNLFTASDVLKFADWLQKSVATKFKPD